MTEKCDAIANAYLTAYRHSRGDHDALTEIDKIFSEPFAGLTFITCLVNQAANETELAFVAAGPLEDLLTKYIEIIFEPLDDVLRANAKMRKAITGVWAMENTKTRQVLDKLLNKYGLSYGTL